MHYTFKIKSFNYMSPSIHALLDTGSAFNVIRYDLPDESLTISLAKYYDSHGAKVEVIGDNKIQTLSTVMFESIIIGEFTITDPKFTTFVIDNIGDEAIIGYPLMQYLEMVLDFRSNHETASINSKHLF